MQVLATTKTQSNQIKKKRNASLVWCWEIHRCSSQFKGEIGHSTASCGFTHIETHPHSWGQWPGLKPLWPCPPSPLVSPLARRLCSGNWQGSPNLALSCHLTRRRSAAAGLLALCTTLSHLSDLCSCVAFSQGPSMATGAPPALPRTLTLSITRTVYFIQARTAIRTALLSHLFSSSASLSSTPTTLTGWGPGVIVHRYIASVCSTHRGPSKHLLAGWMTGSIINRAIRSMPLKSHLLI